MGANSRLISQERAYQALQMVDRVRDELNSAAEELSRFRAYAIGFPAMIQTNGLGSALTFCLSKGSPGGTEQKQLIGRAYQRLYRCVVDWLTHEQQPFAGTSADDFLRELFARDMGRYRLAEAEAMELAVWIRKFARARIPAGEAR